MKRRALADDLNFLYEKQIVPFNETLNFERTFTDETINWTMSFQTPHNQFNKNFTALETTVVESKSLLIKPKSRKKLLNNILEYFIHSYETAYTDYLIAQRITIKSNDCVAQFNSTTKSFINYCDNMSSGIYSMLINSFDYSTDKCLTTSLNLSNNLLSPEKNNTILDALAYTNTPTNKYNYLNKSESENIIVPKTEPDFIIGFQTAAGQNIKPNKKALLNAATLFNDIILSQFCDDQLIIPGMDQDEKTIIPNEQIIKSEIKSNDIVLHDPKTICDQPPNNLISTGFVTGCGKVVCINPKSLEKIIMLSQNQALINDENNDTHFEVHALNTTLITHCKQKANVPIKPAEVKQETINEKPEINNEQIHTHFSAQNNEIDSKLLALLDNNDMLVSKNEHGNNDYFDVLAVPLSPFDEFLLKSVHDFEQNLPNSRTNLRNITTNAMTQQHKSGYLYQLKSDPTVKRIPLCRLARLERIKWRKMHKKTNVNFLNSARLNQITFANAIHYNFDLHEHNYLMWMPKVLRSPNFMPPLNPHHHKMDKRPPPHKYSPKFSSNKTTQRYVKSPPSYALQNKPNVSTGTFSPQASVSPLSMAGRSKNKLLSKRQYCWITKDGASIPIPKTFLPVKNTQYNDNFKNGFNVKTPDITNIDTEIDIKLNGLTDTEEGKMALITPKDMFKIFINMPGVVYNMLKYPDPETWFYNHYKWIILKLASMELRFPTLLAGHLLTPHNVLSQLKYRYDREIDLCHRSCLKRIMEHDDIPEKTMVLFVSDIYIDNNDITTNSDNLCETNYSKNKHETNNNQILAMELSDGWYAIQCVVDQPLLQLIKGKKIGLGDKLCISYARLIGSCEPETPLLAYKTSKLAISYNSTRRAKWWTKLGYLASHVNVNKCGASSATMTLPLKSLRPNGGPTPQLCLIILRTYPLLYIVKKSNNTSVCVNERTFEQYHQLMQSENQYGDNDGWLDDFSYENVKHGQDAYKKELLTDEDNNNSSEDEGDNGKNDKITITKITRILRLRVTDKSWLFHTCNSSNPTKNSHTNNHQSHNDKNYNSNINLNSNSNSNDSNIKYMVAKSCILTIYDPTDDMISHFESRKATQKFCIVSCLNVTSNVYNNNSTSNCNNTCNDMTTIKRNHENYYENTSLSLNTNISTTKSMAGNNNIHLKTNPRSIINLYETKNYLGDNIFPQLMPDIQDLESLLQYINRHQVPINTLDKYYREVNFVGRVIQSPLIDKSMLANINHHHIGGTNKNLNAASTMKESGDGNYQMHHPCVVNMLTKDWNIVFIKFRTLKEYLDLGYHQLFQPGNDIYVHHVYYLYSSPLVCKTALPLTEETKINSIGQNLIYVSASNYSHFSKSPKTQYQDLSCRMTEFKQWILDLFRLHSQELILQCLIDILKPFQSNNQHYHASYQKFNPYRTSTPNTLDRKSKIRPNYPMKPGQHTNDILPMSHEIETLNNICPNASYPIIQQINVKKEYPIDNNDNNMDMDVLHCKKFNNISSNYTPHTTSTAKKRHGFFTYEKGAGPETMCIGADDTSYHSDTVNAENDVTNYNKVGCNITKTVTIPPPIDDNLSDRALSMLLDEPFDLCILSPSPHSKKRMLTKISPGAISENSNPHSVQVKIENMATMDMRNNTSFKTTARQPFDKIDCNRSHKHFVGETNSVLQNFDKIFPTKNSLFMHENIENASVTPYLLDPDAQKQILLSRLGPKLKAPFKPPFKRKTL